MKQKFDEIDEIKEFETFEEFTEEQRSILKKINRKQRIPIAEDILKGMKHDELVAKYDYYSVTDMQREIAKLQGNPWVCKNC
jgi:predicted ATP-dependent protease